MKINRRDLMKLGVGAVTARAFNKQASAKTSKHRVVVFGADGLRYKTAKFLYNKSGVRPRQRRSALSRLNAPVLNLSGGGLSVTQPGWADIWTGLPAPMHGFYRNQDRNRMPEDIHIMNKLIKLGFYAVWVVGKGIGYLDGADPLSPHHSVYRRIVLEGRPGYYLADSPRKNRKVFDNAYVAFGDMVRHENFCAFVHFPDPDGRGHATENLVDYLVAANLVDGYIGRLMDLLPGDTHIIYCSDHGWDFRSEGAPTSNHQYAPDGMAATSFETDHHTITRPSLGRWIYRLAGGDPDWCTGLAGPEKPYQMYGVDIATLAERGRAQKGTRHDS